MLDPFRLKESDLHRPKLPSVLWLPFLHKYLPLQRKDLQAARYNPHKSCNCNPDHKPNEAASTSLAA